MDKEDKGEVVIEEVVVEGAGAANGRNGIRKDRFLPVSIIVAAVILGGAIVFSSIYRPGTGIAGGNNGADAGGNAAAPATTAAQVMNLGQRDAVLGNASAPVTLIEYGDYQCPFCARFFGDTEPQIISNYVNTGKVKMVFRDFPFLGSESTAAAEAAECANDQGKLWPYHDALYTAKLGDESNGGGENDGFYNRALFLQLASKVGLNISDFTSCIDGNKDAGIVNQDKAAAGAAGVNSTPTFFVNGAQIMGAQPYSVFQQAIDTALK